MGGIVLRAPTSADMPFVRSVFFETQRWIIEDLFGWRGDDVELAKFEESYDAANTSIIVVDGEDAGWITVQRDAHIELDALYLKPSMQGRGLGTALVQRLISEAQTNSKPLRLGTAKINPARRLYERLGFVNVNENEFKIFMEWRPTATGIKIRRAIPADADAACVVIRESITQLCRLDHGGDEGHLRKWLSNKTTESVRRWIEESNVFVAYDDKNIVGVAAMRDDGKVTLNYVAPTARFRGVSKALMARIEEAAKSLGIAVCVLESTKTALPFYESLGYEKSPETYEMPLTKTKALVLKKRLVWPVR